MLKISNLSVAVGDKKILENLSFSCPQGSITACMGPNGSGKSSLFNAIMGHSKYQVLSGFIEVNGADITTLPVNIRAQAGLFLTLQQPYEIPGLLVSTLLKESFRALFPHESMDMYIDRLALGCSLLQINRSMLDRAVHAGFSGGEKKKLEMLQVFIAQPKLLMLDEIDSGLDVDARQCVGKALAHLRHLVPTMTILIVTHSESFFEYLQPDFVHILSKGALQKSGTKELLTVIAKSGYGH